MWPVLAHYCTMQPTVCLALTVNYFMVCFGAEDRVKVRASAIKNGHMTMSGKDAKFPGTCQISSGIWIFYPHVIQSVTFLSPFWRSLSL